MKRITLEAKVTLLGLLAAICLSISMINLVGKDSLSFLRDGKLNFIETIMEATSGQITALASVGFIALCMAIHAANRDEQKGAKLPIEDWETNHQSVMGKDRFFPH